MLCAHCHKNDATVHITAVNKAELEKIDLCKDCAAVLGLGDLTPGRVKELSVAGKRCEFCSRDAVSGTMVAGNAVYWCDECNIELGRIIAELSAAERPDLMKRSKASPLSFVLDPELRAWSEAVQAKAVEVLRERRRRERGNQRH